MNALERQMDLPTIDALYEQAIEKLKMMGDGHGRDGFAALVDAARYFAIAEVCAAIRKDFRTIPEKKNG